MRDLSSLPLAGVLLSALLIGCGADNRACTPGAAVACTCADGRHVGSQICNGAGTALGECVCSVDASVRDSADETTPLDAPTADRADAGGADAFMHEAGDDAPDTPSLDAAPPDVATIDVVLPDVVLPDVVLPDVATIDVVAPDAPSLDVAAPDVSTRDATVSDVPPFDVPVRDVAAPDIVPSPDVPTPDVAADVGITAAERSAFATLLTDVQSQLSSSHTPGASVAVVLRGQLAFAGAVGVRNVVSGAPVTTFTRFRAGSLSKMVLAATAMSLVRDGMLDVHAPLTRYLPWFHLATGFDASTLTVDRLLSHSASFPCDTIVQCNTPATRTSRQTFFMNNPQPLWAPVGAIWDYSNAGYGLASQALVAAAGLADTDFEQLVHDRVFVPAGMTTATYDIAAAMTGDYATGYGINASGAIVTTHNPATYDCPLLHPSGGVMATATDYAHLAEALLANGGAVLAPAGVAAMESPHASLRALPTEGYGYGLIQQFSPYPTHASVWHDGELPGFTSILWMVPDRQFAVVVLTNAVTTQPVTVNIVSNALGLYLHDATMVPPQLTAPSTWSGYAGTYNDPYGTLGMGVVVTVGPLVGGTRTVQVDAPNATDTTGHLVPVHGVMRQLAVDEWMMPNNTMVTFFPDASGIYRYFSTRLGVAVR